MELRIDISSPREIAQGLMILQSLAMAHQAHQASVLNPVPKAPAPEQGPPTAPVVTAHAEAAPVPAANADAPIKRKPGRPKKNEQPVVNAATPKQAAAQPVGVALKGVPARDLAAALGDPSPAPVAARPAVAGDDDLAGLLAQQKAASEPDAADDYPAPAAESVPDADDNTEIMINDDDLFAPAASDPEPIPEPKPVDPFAELTLAQLEQMWRAEGSKRGIHWMRALIEKHGIRSPKDLTREMIVEVLKNPEAYMPPEVG